MGIKYLIISAYAQIPRLGKNRKIGYLKRLAGVCINDGVCGLIRQYTGNLTNCNLYSNINFYR